MILLEHDTNVYNTFESGSNQLTFRMALSVKLTNRRINSKALPVMEFLHLWNADDLGTLAPQFTPFPLVTTKVISL